MALVPISVFAAGLGKLNVMSGLGEPLKADIELISVTPEELSSITAAIASEEAYATQGIEKPASHNTIKVDVSKNAAGAPILKLKSAQPISEPFLDMLIQVDWASGRLLREYTVSLIHLVTQVRLILMHKPHKHPLLKRAMACLVMLAR